MAALDFLKKIGAGIVSLPGKVNEARFTHASGPGRLIPIGKDPDTGEPAVHLTDEELQRAYYDPATGQSFMQEEVPPTRTGQSGFGRFVSKMPGMLSAGLAAAAAPTIPGQSGMAAALSSMNTGYEHAVKKDMLQYNMQRQREQDRRADELRQSQVLENIAQARASDRRYQAEAKALASPKTYQELLTRLLEAETDPVKREAIEKKLAVIVQGGQPADKGAEDKKLYENRKTWATEQWGPSSKWTDAQRLWVATNHYPTERTPTQKQPIFVDDDKKPGTQKGVILGQDANGNPITIDVPGARRTPVRKPGRAAASTDVKPATAATLIGIEKERTKMIQAARNRYSKRKADMMSAEDPKVIEDDLKRDLAEAEELYQSQMRTGKDPSSAGSGKIAGGGGKKKAWKNYDE